jgi:galactose mutarotase-like enzyme
MNKVVIRKGTYLGRRAVFMDNGTLSLALLPAFGFKMASLFYKPTGFESLFQPTAKSYKKLTSGACFEKYDTSGCDDMLPTIDACTCPGSEYQGARMPDHGEVWGRSWCVNIIDDSVKGSVELDCLPMKFTRTVSFDAEHTVRFDYIAQNLGKTTLRFLWTLHPLNVLRRDTKLMLPKGSRRLLNVQPESAPGLPENEIDFGSSGLSVPYSIGHGHSCKFYVNSPLQTGCAGLYYPQEKLALIYRFDPVKLPYLGVWINTGGFKNEVNIAIEPSNGFYDSLERAVSNATAPAILPGDDLSWSLRIDLKPLPPKELPADLMV